MSDFAEFLSRRDEPGEGAGTIEAQALVKTYRNGAEEIRALRGIDISVDAGDFIAINGASGSGKSTLLHILGGLDRPDSGNVLLEGKELSGLSDGELAAIRRRRLGFVLQFFNLLPTLTAAENAAFPMLLDGAPDAMVRAGNALAKVGLENRADHLPAQLSGGEQQRVALARALAGKPAVVLADEPTGNLDSHTGEGILQLLRKTADAGQTIVLVTHDDRIARYADSVLYLTDGRLSS